jgi:hypothetical protein
LANKTPTSQQIITIALHHFVGNEKEKAIFCTDDDASSFRSGMSGFSMRSNRTKFLPHSRFRDIDNISFSSNSDTTHQASGGNLDVRRNSIRKNIQSNLAKSTIDLTEDEGEEESNQKTNLEVNYSVSLMEEFRSFSKMKPSELAKLFVKIESPSLSKVLLSQELSLVLSIPLIIRS